MASNHMTEVLSHLRRMVLLRDAAALTDGQLMENYLRCRDEAALATLVGRHGPMVWGVCCRVLHNYHDAEDAFQATFLVFVRKAASIASRELLGNWLYGVAHKTALKARAAAAKRKARERQVTQMPEPTVADQDLWRDLRPLLDRELSRLPDKYRVAIVLCDLERRTRKEAAGQLSVPEGTLAARLARGRALLAKRLARHGLAISSAALGAMLSQKVASAGVPTSVLWDTIKLAAGQRAATGVISTAVAALTEGVRNAMFVAKLKIAAAVLVLVSMVGIGGGLHTVLTVSAEQQKTNEAKAKTAGKGKNQTKSDKDKLQGGWVMLSVVENGRETKRPEGYRVAFKGENFTIEAGAEMKGSFNLDPSAKPKAVDFKMTEGPEKGRTAVGIYKLEGKDLTICFAKPGTTDRPVEFVSNENTGKVLLVLRLVAADETSGRQEPRLRSAELFGQIESQAFKDSQIEEHVFQLTDLRGPRNVGSPALHASREWLREQLVKYGLKDVHTEDVPPMRIAPGLQWNPRGWTWTRLVVQLTAPWKTTLVGVPALYSPSTDGVVTGETVIAPWPQANDAAIMSYIDEHRGKLHGKILLLQQQQEAIQPVNYRYSAVELAELERPGPSAVPESARTPVRPARYVQATNPPLSLTQWNRIFSFLTKEGVVAILRPAPGDGGTVFLRPPMAPPDVVASPPPVIDLLPEHYNMLVRLGKRKIPVRLEIELHSHWVDTGGVKNLFADIAGTDKRDEFVLVGAHLDSWHCGTGATDNACNVAVLLESARILSNLKLPLRRTIRFAFWDGHELGLLGSRGYAAKHLVDPLTKEKTPEYAKLSCYFNLDYGSGRIRGLYLQGRAELTRTIGSWLVKDVDGPVILSPRTTLGSDQGIFEGVGIPGLSFVQDPLNYEQRTHHTNMDVSDYISVDDLRHSVLVLTELLCNAAMSEKPLTHAR